MACHVPFIAVSREAECQLKAVEDQAASSRSRNVIKSAETSISSAQQRPVESGSSVFDENQNKRKTEFKSEGTDTAAACSAIHGSRCKPVVPPLALPGPASSSTSTPSGDAPAVQQEAPQSSSDKPKKQKRKPVVKTKPTIVKAGRTLRRFKLEKKRIAPRGIPKGTHNVFTHFPKDPNCPICQEATPVSYTHLTLPTNREV